MKIVLRLPNELGDLIYAFPLLHGIHQAFPKARIQVIAPPTVLHYLDLLPFEVESFEIDLEKHEGVLAIHKYCYNLKEVFNVEIYFSLVNSLPANLMGFYFRSEKSIGYKNKMGKLYLTHQIEADEQKPLCLEWLDNIALVSDHKLDLENIQGKKPRNTLEDLERYIIVDLSLEGSNDIFSKSEKLLDILIGIEDVDILFIGNAETFDAIDEFIYKLEKFRAKARIVNISKDFSPEKLPALASYAKGVITSNIFTGHIASYLGTPVYFCSEDRLLSRRRIDLLFNRQKYIYFSEREIDENFEFLADDFEAIGEDLLSFFGLRGLKLVETGEQES